jgi:preprotein translocase subunit SecA
LQAAVEEIRELNDLGRPVLAGARSIETSEILSEMLTEAGISHQLLNANEDDREAEIIAKAGQRGTVTISTAMAGRGTHISLGDGVESLGGLHVLVLEMEESRRIDRQLLGRAGRQGKPGSGRIYLSLEDHLVSRFQPELADRPDVEVGEQYFRRLQSEAEVRAYRNRMAVVEQDRWNDETKLRLAH